MAAREPTPMSRLVSPARLAPPPSLFARTDSCSHSPFRLPMDSLGHFFGADFLMRLMDLYECVCAFVSCLYIYIYKRITFFYCFRTDLNSPRPGGSWLWLCENVCANYGQEFVFSNARDTPADYYYGDPSVPNWCASNCAGRALSPCNYA